MARNCFHFSFVAPKGRCICEKYVAMSLVCLCVGYGLIVRPVRGRIAIELILILLLFCPLPQKRYALFFPPASKGT